MTDRELLEQILKSLEEMKRSQEEMRRDQEEMKRSQEAMRRDQEEMKRSQEAMRQDQEEMKQDIKLIHLTLENDITPTINLLLEMQLENSKRFIRLEKSVQKLQDDYVIDEVLRDIIH